MIRALPEVFRTAHLVAQRIDERHLADLERLHADPVVAEWLGGPATAEGLTEWTTSVIAPHWHMYGYGLYALYEKQATAAATDGAAADEAAAEDAAAAARRFVGRAGLVDAGDDVTAAFGEKRVVEIDFAVAAGARARGYATEIAGALSGLALTSLDRESVAALVRPGNAAALRVLEKLDFADAGEVVREGVSYLLLRRRR